MVTVRPRNIEWNHNNAFECETVAKTIDIVVKSTVVEALTNTCLITDWMAWETIILKKET